MKISFNPFNLLIAAATLALAACAFVQKNIVPVAQDLTKQYCAVPESERLLIRQQVNQAIAPNSIVVTCAGEPPVGP